MSYDAYLPSTYGVTKDCRGSAFLPQFANLALPPLRSDDIEQDLREAMHTYPPIDEHLCRVNGLVRYLNAAAATSQNRNNQRNNQVIECVYQQHLRSIDKTNPPLRPPSHVTINVVAQKGKEHDGRRTLKQAQKDKESQTDKKKILSRPQLVFVCMSNNSFDREVKMRLMCDVVCRVLVSFNCTFILAPSKRSIENFNVYSSRAEMRETKSSHHGSLVSQIRAFVANGSTVTYSYAAAHAALNALGLTLHRTIHAKIPQKV